MSKADSFQSGTIGLNFAADVLKNICSFEYNAQNKRKRSVESSLISGKIIASETARYRIYIRNGSFGRSKIDCERSIRTFDKNITCNQKEDLND